MEGYPTHSQIRAARSMLGLKQSELASRADISRSVVFGLEQPSRQRPDNFALARLRDVFREEGLVLLEATEALGEGVRWREPTGKTLSGCLRHARAMLNYSLDDLAEKADIGRYVISRLEGGRLRRTPEKSLRTLRDALFENGIIILSEEVDIGAGVRLRKVSEGLSKYAQ